MHRVAHFSAGGQVFYEDDLRELVHQKQPDADNAFGCYCFRHTPDSSAFFTSLRPHLPGKADS